MISTMEPFPFYRLRDLLFKKYGENNFNTGCTLLAWFLTYEIKEPYSKDWVRLICETTEASSGWTMLKSTEAEALRAFFKLSSPRELYSIPETAPASFNQQ
jgi:hypothetical protein